MYNRGQFFCYLTALHYFDPTSVVFIPVQTRRVSLVTVLAIFVSHIHPLANIVGPPPISVLIVVALRMWNVIGWSMRQPISAPFFAPFAFGRVDLMWGELFLPPC